MSKSWRDKNTWYTRPINKNDDKNWRKVRKEKRIFSDQKNETDNSQVDY